MTPEQLAAMHPRLYHVTTPGAWPSIARIGLLPPVELVRVFEGGDACLAQRRPGEVALRHARHGTAVLNDNSPLSMAKLATCLDDGLTPEDWLRMLNARVFFWVAPQGCAALLGARANRGRPRDVLVFDTLTLARAHAARVQVSPINSGATLRRPTRRGLATFAPLLATDYGAWRRQRGLSSPDTIKELVVEGGIADIARYFRGTLRPDGSVAAP